ncbi:MAG: glycosyltransferase family 4 protein [Saprospiraceae bacterium]
MRIAVCARLLVRQEFSGVHLYVLEQLRQLLSNTDHDVLLITDREGPLPELPREVERVTAYPSARHPVLFYAWFQWAVPRALKRWNADVFLTMDNFCSLRTSVPTVLVIHDLAYLHLPEGVSRIELAYYRYFMPRFAKRAEALVTVSDYTRQDVAKSYGLSPKQISVAYNGVRPRFQELSPKQVATVQRDLTDGAPYFVYVGAVHPRKNVDGLIRGFNRFKRYTQLPHKLVIAGQMAWKTSATQKEIDCSNFKSDIILTGYLSVERLGEVIGGATALCLVSFFEGFGVPIIEAFSCGVPVIVSDRSSLPEVAGPGGITVDPTNDKAIGAALTEMATDEKRREVLAKAGKEHAQQFTWAASGEVILERLEALASRA